MDLMKGGERNVGTEGKGTKRGGFWLEEAGAVVGGDGEGEMGVVRGRRSGEGEGEAEQLLHVVVGEADGGDTWRRRRTSGPRRSHDCASSLHAHALPPPPPTSFAVRHRPNRCCPEHVQSARDVHVEEEKV